MRNLTVPICAIWQYQYAQFDSANMREFFRNRIIFRNLWPLEPGPIIIVYYLALDFRYVSDISKSDY
jgi:hypothetical protein